MKRHQHITKEELRNQVEKLYDGLQEQIMERFDDDSFLDSLLKEILASEKDPGDLEGNGFPKLFNLIIEKKMGSLLGYYWFNKSDENQKEIESLPDAK